MGITERKEREKHSKRQAILEAAKTLFQEKGFLNVTIQDIASYAEVSPGSIYLHYKSKEDIYAAIANLGSQKVDNLLQDYLSKAKITIKDTESFLTSFMAIYEEFGTYFDALVLSFKGKKAFPDLSDASISSLKQIPLYTLMRAAEFLISKGCNDPIEEIRSRVLVCWAVMLGTAKVLDFSRENLLEEKDKSQVIEQSAIVLHNNFFKNTH